MIDDQKATQDDSLDNPQTARPLWRRPEVSVLDVEKETNSGPNTFADGGTPGSSDS